MQTVINVLTSKGGWAGVAAGIVWFFTSIAPVMPPVWGNLISAILGVVALYYHGQTVGKVNGMK